MSQVLSPLQPSPCCSSIRFPINHMFRAPVSGCNTSSSSVPSPASNPSLSSCSELHNASCTATNNFLTLLEGHTNDPICGSLQAPIKDSHQDYQHHKYENSRDSLYESPRHRSREDFHDLSQRDSRDHSHEDAYKRSYPDSRDDCHPKSKDNSREESQENSYVRVMDVIERSGDKVTKKNSVVTTKVPPLPSRTVLSSSSPVHFTESCCLHRCIVQSMAEPLHNRSPITHPDQSSVQLNEQQQQKKHTQFDKEDTQNLASSSDSWNPPSTFNATLDVRNMLLKGKYQIPDALTTGATVSSTPPTAVDDVSTPAPNDTLHHVLPNRTNGNVGVDIGDESDRECNTTQSIGKGFDGHVSESVEFRDTEESDPSTWSTVIDVCCSENSPCSSSTSVSTKVLRPKKREWTKRTTRPSCDPSPATNVDSGSSTGTTRLRRQEKRQINSAHRLSGRTHARGSSTSCQRSTAPRTSIPSALRFELLPLPVVVKSSARALDCPRDNDAIEHTCTDTKTVESCSSKRSEARDLHTESSNTHVYDKFPISEVLRLIAETVEMSVEHVKKLVSPQMGHTQIIMVDADAAPSNRPTASPTSGCTVHCGARRSESYNCFSDKQNSDDSLRRPGEDSEDSFMFQMLSETKDAPHISKAYVASNGSDCRLNRKPCDANFLLPPASCLPYMTSCSNVKPSYLIQKNGDTSTSCLGPKLEGVPSHLRSMKGVSFDRSKRNWEASWLDAQTGKRVKKCFSEGRWGTSARDMAILARKKAEESGIISTRQQLYSPSQFLILSNPQRLDTLSASNVSIPPPSPRIAVGKTVDIPPVSKRCEMDPVDKSRNTVTPPHQSSEDALLETIARHVKSRLPQSRVPIPD